MLVRKNMKNALLTSLAAGAAVASTALPAAASSASTTEASAPQVGQSSAVDSRAAAVRSGAGFAWPFDLAPFQVGVLPSHFFGETEVCVKNLSASKKATVNITLRVGRRDINPGTTACYRNWFWGTPIIVNNISSSTGAWVRTWTK